jgi:hypothetical protein
MIKTRMRWAEYVERIGTVINVYRTFFSNLKGGDHFGDPDIDGG